MSLPTTRLAYEAEEEAFLKAADNEYGVRIKVETYEAAFAFRMRLHQFRKIDRDDNRATYSEDHPMWGRSEYDRFICRIKHEDGHWYVRIERHSVPLGDIEPIEAPKLSYETAEPEPPAEPAPKLIAEPIPSWRRF